MVIEKTGHSVNLSTDNLRELQTDLWGGSAWEKVYEVAVFTANKADAATHGPKFKPLSVEARIAVGKIPASGETQEDKAVATNLGGDLEGEVQAGGMGQGTPSVQEREH